MTEPVLGSSHITQEDGAENGEFISLAVDALKFKNSAELIFLL